MAGETSRDIRRVREDLRTMREVLGAEPPFGRAVLLAWLGVAGVSTLAAVAALTGSAIASGAAGVLSLMLMASVMWWIVRARSSRGAAPVTWREVRTVATAKLTGGPVLAVVLYWFWRLGLPMPYVVAFAALSTGLAAFLYGTTRPWRRVAFGLATPLLVFGAAVPVLPGDRIPLVAAVAGVAAGLACAAILWVQIRLQMAAAR